MWEDDLLASPSQEFNFNILAPQLLQDAIPPVGQTATSPSLRERPWVLPAPTMPSSASTQTSTLAGADPPSAGETAHGVPPCLRLVALEQV
ncbi:hypothetical protein AV530_020167 [Patagioenas fasciata monilis]|uniref:Uncharacterized protein n=1 Tax=Patagioenas fasciata monilis TaxID=372326 RepID=A0A1V4L034_PATFA|nr:hypothetical protein AV530_020167 [Patagioenas fasciata monilis]